MKILLATPDRDLLSGFKSYFEINNHDVATAFDGVQLANRAVSGAYDAAVIDLSLPRVGIDDAISLMKSRGVPTVVMTKKRVTPKMLAASVLANAYISFPFLPEELASIINDLTSGVSEIKSFTLNDVEIVPLSFIMKSSAGALPLTVDEIKILSAVAQGEKELIRSQDVYIDSLCAKLAALGSDYTIKYTISKGYDLVKNDE